MAIPTRPIDIYDVEMMLVSSVIPASCDIFRDEATYRDYSDVATWIEDLIGLDVPVDPTVSQVVADGDSPAAREHVRRIQERLAECGP